MTDQVPVPQAAADAAMAAIDGLTWAFAGDEADAITSFTTAPAKEDGDG